MKDRTKYPILIAIKKALQVTSMGLALSLLAACNSGSSNNNNDDDNSNTQTPNTDRVFTASTNDEAEPINPTALATELNSIFGNANDDPVAIESGDTLTDVLNRANNN